MARAKVVKTFRKGSQRCQTWRFGNVRKNVCWDWRRRVMKRFVRNGKKCVIYRQGFRDFQKSSRKVVAKFRSRNAYNKVEGYNTRLW